MLLLIYLFIFINILLLLILIIIRYLNYNKIDGELPDTLNNLTKLKTM